MASEETTERAESKRASWVRWFDELGIEDVGIVGGKNASLGELSRLLRGRDVTVPGGFAITADAYRSLLDEAGAWTALHAALDDIAADDPAALARAGARARDVVYSAPLPPSLEREIRDAYARLLSSEHGDETSVAVRSSATAEDLPTSSFAGQHESYLNVRGEEQLLDACKRCFASLFTDRAIHYRLDRGFGHFDVALSVSVQKMVRSDLASAGVIFTLDPESGFRDVVLVTGSYGLGENVVKGAVDPDEFYVFKPTFERGHRSVLRRALGSKKIRMVYAHGETRRTTRDLPTDRADRARFCIDDQEVLALSATALEIERHYSEKAGQPRPMDIEWAKDGVDGRLYIVQARPETVASQVEGTKLETFHVEPGGEVLVTGRAVGERAASGTVRMIRHTADLGTFRPGDVLVADTTTPDWEPVMKAAAAIVTNRGGRTCHAAIVARELGIPAVVGTQEATTTLTSGQPVTVSCAEGETGRVYRGELPIRVDEVDLSQLPRPRTAIMVNVGNPDVAFAVRALPNDGVGLARMEFIINESIQAHPMALLHPERIGDAADRRAIERLTAGYPSAEEYFVQRLSEGVGTIAAAFYPRPVIVRMSDFKSNEYAALLGGRDFEPIEENPMLGFRGAARYTHPRYAEGFALECAAMKRVREEMGLDNVRLMIPFCRRVDEAERVVAALAEHGLERGQAGLELYMMCEIPNNVLQLDAFARFFDGFSIGSNDLTQLTLGVDRDSELVAFDFDERDPGVKALLRLAVEGCRRVGRHSGLCGQAPSDYPDMAEFLVEIGIDSMSLNPDSVLAVTRRVLEVEERLGRRGGKAVEGAVTPER